MKYIAVVDCASSGEMYIRDIIEMGYRPLVIYTYIDAEHAQILHANVEKVKKRLNGRTDIIQISKDLSFDELLKKVKAYDIICVVPGSETGVTLADQLNKALGLKGNDPETTQLRCTKKGMYDALLKAKIRAIKTEVVTDPEQIIKFWKENKLSRAVMKFSESSGTVGLKTCGSLEDSLDYFKQMQSMYNLSGFRSQILIQEHIGGTEYVVNSLSIDGRHKITDVWRYEKFIDTDGVLIYDTMVLVDRLVPGMQELLQYDYKVLDAVEMKNGFCHNEIKVDENGPVLIETNARLMGGNCTREYLDEIFGSHMSDVTLKSLLNPSFFDSYIQTPYLPRKSAMFKFAITPHDLKADLKPFFELVRHLDSYREIVYNEKTGLQDYPRTIDLETSPFFIRMINEDYGKLKQDYELVRLMEERYYGMLFTTEDHVEGATTVTDVNKLINMLPLSRKFALIEEDKVTVIQYGKQTVSDEWEIYDGAIFATCGPTTLTERFRQMMKCMNHIRKGGPVFILPETYQNLPYGSVCAEVVMSVMGFKAQIPPSNGDGILYGVKN